MSLKESLRDIQKMYGDGAAFRLGGGESLAVEVIPTGILSLDTALGVGGFPRGRVVEIYGPDYMCFQGHS